MAATLRHSRTEKSELALNAILPAPVEIVLDHRRTEFIPFLVHWSASPVKTVLNRGRSLSDLGGRDADELLFVMRFRFA